MNKSNLVSALFIVLIGGWMFSGSFTSAEVIAQEKPLNDGVYTVRVKQFQTKNIVKSIKLNGRTEPYLTVTVASEVEGKVTKVLAMPGSVLKTGDLIATLDVDGVQDDLDYALANLKQKEIEYTSAKKLASKGFQGKIQLAKLHTEYKRVKSLVAKLKRTIDRSSIRSPQNGVMNERFVEAGDYVSVGDAVARIEMLDPLIVSGSVTENDIYLLRNQKEAKIRTLDNRLIDGQINYLSSVSDQATNTFRIEIKVPNQDNILYAGTSAEIELPLGVEPAIKVSPSILVLGADGELGIKSVVDGKVRFEPIDILKTDQDGAWIKGLSSGVDIIVLGQGFVSAGESVNTFRVEATNNE